MSFDDLTKALEMFQNGVNKRAVTNAFQEATDQVNMINQQQQDEFAKRQQLEQLGKNFALQLGGMGVPTAQIQGAMGAMMPKQLQNPGDYFEQAAQATNPQVAQQYQQRGDALYKNMDRISAKDKAALAMQQKHVDLGYAQLMGSAQAGAAQVDEKSKRALQEVQYRYDTMNNNAAKLRSLIENKGTFEATGSASNEMDSLIEEMAEDFAKLVDPESVARETEVEQAKKMIAPIRSLWGLGTRNETALALIDKFQKRLDSRLQSRLKSVGVSSVAGVQQTSYDNARNLSSALGAQLINLQPSDPRYRQVQERMSYLNTAMEAARKRSEENAK